MTVVVCFRVKCLMSNGFSQYVTNPEPSAYIQRAELCEWLSPKITSRALCRWRETFVNIPEKLNSSSSSCCRSRCDCFNHLTIALYLSLCCESYVHESVFMSLRFSFSDIILETKTRAPALSVTRR